MNELTKTLITAQDLAEALPAATDRRLSGKEVLGEQWQALNLNEFLAARGFSAQAKKAVQITGETIGATAAIENTSHRPGFGKVVTFNPKHMPN